MIDTINETFKFFHFSPKRQRFFESILDKESESHAVKKLKGLCKTRCLNLLGNLLFALPQCFSLFRRNATSLTKECSLELE